MKNLREFMQARFYVPYYQRNYAWESVHATQLLEDFSYVADGHAGARPHYLANFVLMRREDSARHQELIDGQQRMTTVVMLLAAIARTLKVNGDKPNVVEDIAQIIWPLANDKQFILASDDDRNRNFHFLEKLLKNEDVSPANIAQRNMWGRYNDFCRCLSHKKGDFLAKLRDCILDSEVTTHEVADFVEANRIFNTLNTRGRPLTNFEKIKSLLIYYAAKSDRISLAKDVNQTFQKISENIEIIEGVLERESPKLRLVNDKKDQGDEDVFIGWHYCFVEENQRQVKSAKDVHDTLETKLKEMADPEQVKSFIYNYIGSAKEFFQGLADVLENIKLDPQYYEVIGICGLTRVVWPLVVAASVHRLLDGIYELPNGRKLSLLRLIQLVDKLHKAGQFQGQPLISLAYDLYNDRASVDKAIKQIVEYHQLWNRAGYTLIERVKPEEDYFDYLLFSYALQSEGNVSIDRLRELRRMSLSSVKVLTKYDDSIVRRHGFARHKDFNEWVNCVGNYILVAGARNIREQQEGDDGVSPARLKDLVSDSGKLVLADTKFQLDKIDGGLPDMGVNRGSIEVRTQEIEEFLDESWEILEAEYE